MIQVLIADDELRERNIVKILLERHYPDQFTFSEAENGVEALKLIQAGSFDLVLLDINMPGLSGLDVLHELEHAPYIIILTAYNYFEYAREAMRLGVKDFLSKPPVRDELFASIDRFLDEKRSRPAQAMPEAETDLGLKEDLPKQDSELFDQLVNLIVQGNMTAAQDMLRSLIQHYGSTARLKIIQMLTHCGQLLLPEKSLAQADQMMIPLLDAPSDARILEAAYRYLQWLSERMTDRANGKMHPIVMEIVQLIAADLANDWRIDTLADMFHINSFYLSRLFKEEMHQNFTDYLAEQRILKSIQLMKNPSLSLAEISEDVGFTDPNYFSRVFKKRRGLGPREFRRRQN